MEELKKLYELLDEQAELTLSPTYFQEWNIREHGYTPYKQQEPFSIDYVSPKTVEPGAMVTVFGKGFNKKGYQFYVGKKQANYHKIKDDDNFIILEVPKGIQRGSYDIYAKFNEEITSAIVVRIEVSN
jgi:hypothetical protein